MDGGFVIPEEVSKKILEALKNPTDSQDNRGMVAVKKFTHRFTVDGFEYERPRKAE